MGNMSSDLQNVLLYLSAFFMVFLSFVVFSLCLRVLLWIYIQYADRARRDNREDGSTRGEQWCSRRQESAKTLILACELEIIFIRKSQSVRINNTTGGLKILRVCI
ncbi:unnamed protein product [Ceratitis capitata]|uniref:(Mediterranean fruit fly) hypothetical protein n=1 Tax=Ceratitis capitata TaxID=7213 RepID=A0A811VAA0_CERCA|nr:unnamed protein product [Ceratitis capitata]